MKGELRFTRWGAEKMAAAGVHVEPGDVARVDPDPTICGYRPCGEMLCCAYGATSCPHRVLEDDDPPLEGDDLAQFLDECYHEV